MPTYEITLAFSALEFEDAFEFRQDLEDAAATSAEKLEIDMDIPELVELV